MANLARVLTIAGSDSGGGAGIQADIKTISALGGYAATAITAVTVQNTIGVQDIVELSPADVAGQVEAVLSDIGADAIKIGMIRSDACVHAVTSVLDQYAPDVPLVIDPLICATDGTPLTDVLAHDVLMEELIPRAKIITPNLPEAEQLGDMSITTLDDMKKAAEKISGLGCGSVLITGGHRKGSEVTDVLCGEEGIETFSAERIVTTNTHGTGCTISSAIATGLAQNMSLREAVVRARLYVRAAIESAPDLGRGNGPINHLVTDPGSS